MNRSNAMTGLSALAFWLAALGALAGCDRQNRATPPGSASAQIEAKVIKAVAAQMKVSPRKITRTARLREDLKADDLDIVELTLAIEDDFRVTVPDDAADRWSTVGDVIDSIAALPRDEPAQAPAAISQEKPMASAQQQDDLESLKYHIKREVAAGFTPIDTIVAGALKRLNDQARVEAVRPQAEAALRETLDEHYRAQQNWPAVTDFERLEAAFVALEASGIICRHNFSCCGTCAAAEIWDEIEKACKSGRQVRGCAHYNLQDTESAVEGHGLCFSYGSVQDSEEASVAIGHEIVKAMEQQGLKVTWNGSLSRRIQVAMDWKRRLPRRPQ